MSSGFLPIVLITSCYHSEEAYCLSLFKHENFLNNIEHRSFISLELLVFVFTGDLVQPSSVAKILALRM